MATKLAVVVFSFILRKSYISVTGRCISAIYTVRHERKICSPLALYTVHCVVNTQVFNAILRISDVILP